MAELSPLGPTAEQPAVYWQVAGGRESRCATAAANLAVDRHVTSGGNDDVFAGNRPTRSVIYTYQ